MAHRRDFRRGAAAIRSSRATSWFDLPATATAVTGAGGTLLLSLTAAELARRPFTIERTHIRYTVTSDQVIASESYLGAMGMAVASEQAVAAGITSLPTPVTDDDSEAWFLHDYFMGAFLFGTGVGFTENNLMNRIDSKAKRKVDDGEDVYLAVELGLLSGFIFTAAGRLLIKEH